MKQTYVRAMDNGPLTSEGAGEDTAGITPRGSPQVEEVARYFSESSNTKLWKYLKSCIVHGTKVKVLK